MVPYDWVLVGGVDRQYSKIENCDQRQQYKQDFNREYEEYRRLHEKVQNVSKRFQHLKERISNTKEGSQDYEVGWFGWLEFCFFVCRGSVGGLLMCDSVWGVCVCEHVLGFSLSLCLSLFFSLSLSFSDTLFLKHTHT